MLILDKLRFWWLDLILKDEPDCDQINDHFGNIKLVWYRNKKSSLYHREDGPAVIFHDGEKWWFQFGIRHRTDGPAIISPGLINQWFLYGQYYKFDEYVKLAGWTDEQIVMYKLAHDFN